MKTRVLLALPALALLVLGCGCASNKLSQAVEVSLVNLRFEEVTPFETSATFIIRVQNQTPDPLALEGGVHKIYLDQVYVGSGVCNQSLGIPRLSEGLQTVKVHLRNLSMARLIARIIEEKRVDYRLDSLVYARVEGRSAQLRVSRAGNLDLKDFTPTRPAMPFQPAQ